MASKKDISLAKKMFKLSTMFRQWAKDNDREDMLKGKQGELATNMLIYLIKDNKIKGL